MKAIVQLVRILVGVLFIVSGFVKINDPIGFGFKLEEYWEVFGLPWLAPLSTGMAWFICLFEIVLGFALLVGYKRKWTLWLLTAMIVFFTFLTFYSAWFNKVTDCGCFGDALKLTPWQSFWKDVVLSVLIGILLIGRKHIHSIHAKAGDIVGLATLFFGGYGLYCLYYLPVIDFTAYKVGNNISELMRIPEGAPKDEFKTVLVYVKNGQEKEFTMDNFPSEDTTWTWKDTRNILIKKGYVPPIHDFSLFDLQGNDYTEDFLTADYSLLIVARKLEKADEGPMETLTGLSQWALNNRIKVGGMSSSLPADIAEYTKKKAIPYPFYIADHTTLKTMVRSNPGVLLLHKGRIMGKWSENNLPSPEEIGALLAQ